jgi:outer membrane lipoprotein-sorting protein
MKRLYFISIALFVLAYPGRAQEIVTAERFFDTISAQYGRVEDYQAKIVISQSNTTMEGTIFYKKPNLMRINFTTPRDQVIVMDGEVFAVYVPQQSVILTQKLKKHSSGSLATMASQQGLNLFKKGYSIAYLVGPEAVPLDEKNPEKVKKLKLEWRSTDEGFREIEMSIGENGLIRRLVGVTANFETFTYDLTDLKINQNIPEARFKYDFPPSAYQINNFLFPED